MNFIVCNVLYSAYEVKNYVCLFERPFKVSKNGTTRDSVLHSLLCLSNIQEKCGTIRNSRKSRENQGPEN